MSIDRLSPSASMLELVRSLSKRSDRTEEVRVRNSSAREAPGQANLSALRNRLIELVKHVDMADEQSITQVRRSLFQEIVLWEFGGEFRQHPEYAPMLDTIERAFAVDSEASSRLVRLVRDLRRQP